MVFAMAGVVIVVFFISGFLSWYSRHFSHRRRFRESTGLDLPLRLEGSGHTLSRGLDQQIIDTFPTFVYSAAKKFKIGTSILECAVCLNEFEDRQTLRWIPKCSHVFHPDCIDKWLHSHVTCPVCRANLVPRPDDIPTVAAVAISDAIEPVPRSEAGVEGPSRDSIRVDGNENRTMNLLSRSRTMNQSRPTRSSSTKFLFGILFPRCHSTGHSPVRPGESCERFTLRLPEDVRKQLLNSTMNRSKSCATFIRVSSARKGYRTRSMGGGRGRNYLQYARFDGEMWPDRWRFTLTPPFFTMDQVHEKRQEGNNSSFGIGIENGQPGSTVL